MLKSKEELEIRLNNEISTVKNSITKLEQEVSNRDRRISEYGLKLKTSENENTELKGDVTGMIYHLNSNKPFSCIK